MKEKKVLHIDLYDSNEEAYVRITEEQYKFLKWLGLNGFLINDVSYEFKDMSGISEIQEIN